MTTGFGGGGAKFYTVPTLIDAVLKATGQTTADLDARSRCLEFVNARYLQVLKSKHWRFLMREGIYDLRAPYTTGTATVVNGSNAVTGVGTVWNASMIGQKIILGSDGASYRIQTVPTQTTLTLSSAYQETSQSGVTYKIAFDRVEMPTNAQAVKDALIAGFWKLAPYGMADFRLVEAKNEGLTGTPEIYTVVDQEENSSELTIQLYPSPDRDYSFRFEYNLRPYKLDDEADQYFLIPDNYLDVMYYGVLHDMYRYLADAQNSNSALRDYQTSFSRMVSDNALTDQEPRIQPSRNYYNRVRRGAYRGYFGTRWFGKVDD